MFKLKRQSMIDKIRVRDFKKKEDLPLKEDEKIILQAQGVLKFDQRSGWQPGHFYLTSQRLLFKQVIKIKMEIGLENILMVKSGEGSFIGRKKKLLLLEAKKQNQRKVNAWILVEPVEPWLRRIREYSIKINEKSLDEIFKELDLESSDILDYFLEHGNARINDLSKFLGGAAHSDILRKIKDIINPAAEKVIGAPILVFNRLKLDPLSEKEVAFSWWLIDKPEEKQKDSLLDIFDEGDFLSVILAMPAYCKENDLKVEIQNNLLRIFTVDKEKKYFEEVVLPSETKPAEFIKSLRNNVLEIKLYKKESS